jgi:hypothetical protein
MERAGVEASRRLYGRLGRSASRVMFGPAVLTRLKRYVQCTDNGIQPALPLPKQAP